MSIHMRAQLFLVRPQQLSKLGARSVAMAKSTRSQALALRAPNTLSLVRAPRMIAIGAVLSAGVAAALSSDSALCENMVVFAEASGPSGSSDPAKDKKQNDLVEQWIDGLLSRAGELTLASGLGFCSGYALKQVGKVAAVTIGVVFLVAQAAASQGYIDINWNKVQKDVISKVDATGDGKITNEDIKLWYQKLMVIMRKNLPSSAGFSGGFAIGIACA